MATKRDPENKTLYSRPIRIAEFKAAGDGNYEVSGYVSTFNNMDLGRDIVRPGAFKKTLKDGPKVRFLRDHDPRLLLGIPLKLAEDSKGLFGRFKISKTQLGEDTHELIQDGALDSFSFGYHADDYEIDEKEQVRYLNEVTMYEASMTSMPMNEEAGVTGFKNFFGIQPSMTLAEQAQAYAEGMQKLTNDLRDLVKGIDRPLSETKRQELTMLLESCSGLDAVRADLQSVLVSAPSTHLVSSKRTRYELAELRKRLISAGILDQE